MKRKGFTLVELLIVIAILGVLTAMMQLSGTGATAAAKASAVVNGLRTIRTAANMYANINAGQTIALATFKSSSNDYFDTTITNSQFSVGTETSSDAWYAYYTYATSDTATFKSKLIAYDDVTSADTTKARMTIYTPK